MLPLFFCFWFRDKFATKTVVRTNFAIFPHCNRRMPFYPTRYSSSHFLLPVMCHFADLALEENHAGPARNTKPAASADRAKLWHNLTLLLLHFTSPFLFCCVRQTGSLPRPESVACFLYGHAGFSFVPHCLSFFNSKIYCASWFHSKAE